MYVCVYIYPDWTSKVQPVEEETCMKEVHNRNVSMYVCM